MKKKRQIWIFAVVLAMVAVQGTVFAGTQEIESSEKTMTETTAEIAESDQILDTEVLRKTVKEQINLSEDTKQSLAGNREETGIKKSSTKSNEKPVKKTTDGQTLLDISKGNITITSAGATGGGYKQ